MQCLVYPVGGDGEFEEAAVYGVGHSVGDGCGVGVVGKLADGFRLVGTGAPSGLARVYHWHPALVPAWASWARS